MLVVQVVQAFEYIFWPKEKKMLTSHSIMKEQWEQRQKIGKRAE